jgi:hypothetical protein
MAYGLSRFCLVLVFLNLNSALASEPGQFLLPKPKSVQALARSFVLSANTPVQLRGATSIEDQFTAELLTSEIIPKAAATGMNPGAITLRRIHSWNEYSSSAQDLGDQGYALEVSPAEIILTATTSRGLYYAAQTLSQLAVNSQIPALRILDWPDIANRMVLYDLRDNTVNMAYWKRWLRELSRLKVNQVMIFMGDDYTFKKYSFMSSVAKLTPEKLRELRRFARQHHIELLPHWESLGHAEYVLAHLQFEDLRLAGNPYQYSPCTERTYSVLNDFYRELIAEFDHSAYFHVGGDEVWAIDADPRCGAEMNGRGLGYIYSQHFQRLAGILRAYDRRMAIWSDMLLSHPQAAEGLPRDTVIFDWQYQQSKDFPSLRHFKNLGFRDIVPSAAVLGSYDLYLQLPISIPNIAGFTQAALGENLNTMCTTTWSMSRGNNVENYYYGLAYSAQVTWSSQATELEDFHRRFAFLWYGVENPEVAAHLDRAVWFPWRVSGSSRVEEKGSDGFWNRRYTSGKMFFDDFAKLIGDKSQDDLRRFNGEAQYMLGNLQQADKSLKWLEQASQRHAVTLSSLRMVHLNFRHVCIR